MYSVKSCVSFKSLLCKEIGGWVHSTCFVQRFQPLLLIMLCDLWLLLNQTQAIQSSADKTSDLANQLRKRIHQNPHFPPITLCKNCTQMDELSNSEAWQLNPLPYPDRLLIDFCLWSIPLSFSSFSLSPHPSLLSSATLHHRTSPLSRTYLSLQTNTKPVVTDKALLTKCEMMEECKSVSSSQLISFALYYMINSFPSFKACVCEWVSVCSYQGRVFGGQLDGSS